MQQVGKNCQTRYPYPEKPGPVLLGYGYGRVRVRVSYFYPRVTRDIHYGHRIYWPEKRSVTVERSVKFNFEDEIEIPILPLGKEHIQPETSPIETSDEDVEKKDIIEEIPPTKGKGKRIRKESGYIRRLREGEGVGKTGERTTNVLPRGRSEGTSIMEPELEDFAMATALATAEGLEPTYEEA